MAGQSYSFVTKKLHSNSHILVFPWRPLPSSNAIAIAVHTHDSTTKQPPPTLRNGVCHHSNALRPCVYALGFSSKLFFGAPPAMTPHTSRQLELVQNIMPRTPPTQASKGQAWSTHGVDCVVARTSSHLLIDTSQPHTTLKRRGQSPPIAITPLPQQKKTRLHQKKTCRSDLTARQTRGCGTPGQSA